MISVGNISSYSYLGRCRAVQDSYDKVNKQVGQEGYLFNDLVRDKLKELDEKRRIEAMKPKIRKVNKVL